MWLILCEPNDLAALWAYQGLKKLGHESLELVSSEMLAYSLHWEHRLGDAGSQVKIELSDGRAFSSDSIRGILNRLLVVHIEHLQLANPADRDYAIQELTSFFSSWLHAMPDPVLNRPTPYGLAGHWRPLSEWFWLAGKAGLPITSYKESAREYKNEVAYEGNEPDYSNPEKYAIVIGEHVICSSAPPEIQESCLRLASLSKTILLGIKFKNSSDSSWTFAGATPMPDLRLGGEKLLGVLGSMLKGNEVENQ